MKFEQYGNKQDISFKLFETLEDGVECLESFGI